MGESISFQIHQCLYTRPNDDVVEGESDVDYVGNDGIARMAL